MRGGLIDDACQCAKLLGAGGYSRVAFQLGLAYYLSRRLEDAVRFLEREALRNPDYIYTSVVLAAAYSHLGRASDAQRMTEDVRRRLPMFDARTFGSRLQNRAHHDYVTEGLANGGLN